MLVYVRLDVPKTHLETFRNSQELINFISKSMGIAKKIS